MKSLFSNKNYVYLLMGYTGSIFVDATIFMVALKLIENLSNDTSSYTWLYIVHYLPAVLFSIFIGAWLNTKKLEKIMLNSLLIRFVVLLLFLLSGGMNHINLILLFIFIESFISIFFLPSTDTLVTKIVCKEDRLDANGLIKLIYVLMQGVGYGISTVLIKLDISLVTIFVVCLAFLLVATFLISRIKADYTPDEHTQPIMQEVVDIFSYLKTNKLTSKIFLLFGAAWFVASSIDLIVIAYLTNVSQVSSDNFGIVAIAVFIGMIAGAYLSSYIYGKIPIKYVFSFPLLVYTVTVFTMYVFDNWTYTLPFFLLGGLSLGFFEVCFTTFLQDNNEEKYYTRIFSFQNMILSSMPLPGLLFLGVFIEWTGIRITILLISILLFSLTFVSFLTKYHEVRVSRPNLEK
ncbi:MFS transporter [Priestia filamentosa]|uniref:MFS transporter n=1 Tax=Priestia filamentosa TaxID=1402861 RepID=UPI000588EC75